MTLYNIISPSSLVAGQPEDVSIILANLQSIAGVLNGNLDDSNLKNGGASPGKLVPGPVNSKLVTLSGPAVWTPDVGYGTSLPSTPADGQEYILVDSLTATGYQWRFRYNAGSTSPYKWEFVGGVAAYNRVDTDEGTASTSYVDLASVLSIPAPRPGVYEVSHGAAMYNEGNGIHCYQAIYHDGAVDAATEFYSKLPALMYAAGSKTAWIVCAAAGTVKTQHKTEPGGVAHGPKRWMQLLPVRVS